MRLSIVVAKILYGIFRAALASVRWIGTEEGGIALRRKPWRSFHLLNSGVHNFLVDLSRSNPAACINQSVWLLYDLHQLVVNPGSHAATYKSPPTFRAQLKAHWVLYRDPVNFALKRSHVRNVLFDF